MWIGKEIYYNSDKDGHFNIYAYDTASGKTRQITNTRCGTCAGPRATASGASSTSLTENCRCWM
jgi:Tol biopolymer transport system component